MSSKSTFLDLFGTISDELIDKDSNFQKQIDIAELQFQRFGLTNEQISVFLTEVNKEAIKTFPAYASSSAIEIMKLDQQEEIIAQEILLKKAQVELAEKELQLKDKQIELEDKKIELLEKQIATEEYQKELLEAQKNLVDRQTQGYNDNLLVKASEFQGGLASFAVNSAPENPTTGVAIENFTCLISKLEALSRDTTNSCVYPKP
jgi:hypothetical protein